MAPLLLLFPVSAFALPHSSRPSANTFGGTSAVGALFSTRHGRIGAHFCSASVVDSPDGNVLITAAHCTRHRNLVFIPGYLNGRAPYGIWRVRRVVTSRGWRQRADPDDDVAFLIVARTGRGPSLQDLTGGEGLTFGSPGRHPVQAIGYPDAADAPITCRNRTHRFGRRQLSFACTGYFSGTSGGPLLSDVDRDTGLGRVVGVIGGYQQGGKSDALSYATRFRPGLVGLYHRAIRESG